MKAEMIKTLRERSCVKGKQETWISGLSDKQLYSVFIKIKGGGSNRSIARYVKKYFLKDTKSSIHSLAQGVGKFKKRIADLLLPEKAKDLSLNFESEMSLLDPIQKLELNEQLAALQRARIKRLMAEEIETGVTHSNLSKELHALVSFEKNILKEKEFLIRHENEDILQRFKEMKNDQVRLKEGQKIIDAIHRSGNVNPMVEAIDNFIERVQKHALNLEVYEDGTFNLTKDAE
jgi:hypothetical protein